MFEKLKKEIFNEMIKNNILEHTALLEKGDTTYTLSITIQKL